VPWRRCAAVAWRLQDASLAWVVNGEIYNHTALKARAARRRCRRGAQPA
jgi:hypothetical protein